MKGKRAVGRPRMDMIDNLKEGSYVNMKKRADYNKKIRKNWTPRTC